MNKVFYLEPDEEITKVINRIRTSEEDGVVLVVPRNSTLTQSVINLKLLSRSAAEHGKAIGLVSTDRVTKNLAEQLKIRIFGKAAEAEKALLRSEAPVKAALPDADAALKVHTYRKYDLSKLNDASLGSLPEEKPAQDLDTLPTESEAGAGFSKRPISDSASLAETAERPNPDDDIAVEEESDELEDKVTEDDASRGKIKSKDEDMRFDGSGKRSRHLRMDGRRRFLIAFFSVLVLAIIILVVIFLPTARAALTLKTTDLDKTATISIDKNRQGFDAASNTLGGTMVEMEKSISKSFTPTGQKDSGTPASGTVTISNATNTGAIPVSPGTKVTSTDGLVFTVTIGVLVPGATISNPQLINGKLTYDTTPGTVDAKVTASANGDGYNLPANTKFSVLSMTATNKAAFSGGLTKNIAFVTEVDLANAEKATQDQALTDNKAELLDNAAKASLKVDEKNITVSVISTSADKKASDEANAFAVTANIKLSVLGFSENDLRAAMATLSSNQLSSDQMLVNPESSEMTYKVSSYNAETNILKLDIDFKAKTGAKISADALVKNLKGKNATAAQNYLENQSGVAAVSIHYTPSFWRMMPFVAGRITVVFDYQK